MYPQCYVLNMKCTDDLIVDAFMKGYGVLYGNGSSNDQGAVQDMLEGRPVFLVQEGRLINGSIDEVDFISRDGPVSTPYVEKWR